MAVAAGTVTASVVLVGCGSSSPSPASTRGQYTSWLDGGGQQILSSFERGNQAVANSGSDTSALTHACGSIETDVNTAKEYKPIPDRQAQSDWGRAVSAEDSGASNCLLGVIRSSQDLIDTGINQLEQAVIYLNSVDTRVHQ